MAHPVPAINRQAFIAALEEFISQEALQTGVLLVDLNNLTDINLQTGYAAGDAVIHACLARLQALSKMPNTFFRIGSHHFAFIVPRISNPSLMSLAIHKIKQQLGEPVAVGKDQVQPDVQVGLAFGPPEAANAYLLLKRAERSLIDSRRGKPYRFDVIDDQKESEDQTLLAKAFKKALFGNEFELYYQPKKNLKTGKVDRVEALLRWELKGRGFIAPDQVVLLAEQLGESYTLTKWVVGTAVRQMRQWLGQWNLGVAVNIQAGLVNDPNLTHLVQDALSIWGLDSEYLTLEITESAIIEDMHSGLENLMRLKQAGIALSIDDFGTGYSSLSYFKNIPASELKIDRCFVRDMLVNEQDKHIVKIIIDIAQLFGLQVVAEGVEDGETLQYLAELGCDYAQGYFIAKPLSVADFEIWIKHNAG
ncbi:GGDEF domain-containing phosphodiesterase [Simiduia sp. 21SJ11W-1]|uniref:putative bifunctional diguanylate cyclase/phosphodiesterase n=1 Tax=Simiduia sp. 21SJ11W-1 TaxID=2909669 RepID=UPI0020A231C2|nr:GGDEF domain-containing phosphodiesterase [Simiduia sp. 21SJ11W-1]UTA46711.1 GGDEF domain-containing phosphodiesterase [Simiduia sp. 21SJ11W-1]